MNELKSWIRWGLGIIIVVSGGALAFCCFLFQAMVEQVLRITEDSQSVEGAAGQPSVVLSQTSLTPPFDSSELSHW
ncbi:MAG: hypothetical protein ISN29_06460 [Gammaproteobacteria bacterium AqS3]|nr:hypothetical protein [Gammaproteobacteria bacterium AqS3]